MAGPQGLPHQHPQRQLVVRRPQLGGDLEAESAQEADVRPAEHRGDGRQAIGVARRQGGCQHRGRESPAACARPDAEVQSAASAARPGRATATSAAVSRDGGRCGGP